MRVPSLDVVIVNWNTGRELKEALSSLAASHRDRLILERVVVVDNASSDRSCEDLIRTQLPLTVIRNAVNRGFAAACNQGAAGSTADYLLFLNPDTKLFPDTLANTLAFMEQDLAGSIGICGVRLVDAAGAASTVGARFPTASAFVAQAFGIDRLMPARFPPLLVSADAFADTGEVDQVIGAFFLVRRDLFSRLGGFDERFFVYFEEVDLSLRARREGYRSVCFVGATAVHHGGRSSGQVRAARLFYSLRSRLRYAFKHFSPPGAWLTLAATLGPELLLRLGRATGHRSADEIRDVMSGYASLVRDLVRHGPRGGRRAGV